MPENENQKSQRALQSKHATFIASTRAMSELTGLSPGQIRSNIRHAAARPQSQRGIQHAVDIPRPVSGEAQIVVGPQDQKFEPRPFVEPPTRASGGGPGATVPVADKQLIVVDNGTANYYNFVAEFVAAV